MGTWIGRQANVKNLGETFRIACPMCAREEFWLLWKLEETLTVWGRPWWRYPREHWLVCPACLGRLPVAEEALAETKRIAALHRIFLDGRMAAQEYQERLRVDYTAAFGTVIKTLEQWVDDVLGEPGVQDLQAKAATPPPHRIRIHTLPHLK